MHSSPMLRRLAALGWSLLVVATAAAGAAAEPDASAEQRPSTPAEYEKYALERDPQLKALYERWRSSVAEAKAASSNWSQPRVGYQAFIDGWWQNRAGLTHMGSVSQKFPWPGVLDESADPARKMAEALRHRFEAQVLETIFEVRTILIDLARLDAKIAILDDQARVYEDVRALVQTSIESDEADYGDLLRVNTAHEKILDRIDTLESRREQRVADLRELLNLEPGADLTFDFEGDHDPLGVDESAPNRDALVEQAKKHHPALAAARARADSRRERAEYARLKQMPSPSVSLGVRSMPDYMNITRFEQRTSLLIGVSVPIPLFRAQYDHAHRQFAEASDAELAQRTRTRSELVAGIDGSVTRIDEKIRRLERYRGELVPLAEDATENMRQKIETGERTVTDFLLSFEQELDLQINLVDFRAAIATERARLERLTGGEFDAHSDREAADIDIDDLEETGANDE